MNAVLAIDVVPAQATIDFLCCHHVGEPKELTFVLKCIFFAI